MQEQLVKCIDFKHITDVVTPEAALELLKSVRPGHELRKAQMKDVGYPVRFSCLANFGILHGELTLFWWRKYVCHDQAYTTSA
eukprot:SAG31_NODE_33436_length_344_cov_0.477551_1_plen_82_part_01